MSPDSPPAPRAQTGRGAIAAHDGRTPSWRVWTVVIIALFAFRLTFGLSKELFTEDETQVFLLGLRFHATHQWPFFGPDVVWTQSEIPGALQALLVGVPFDVAPAPEAPYVLLNVLSTGALCLFAAYLCARLRTVPRWLVWAWLLTLPWTLDYSTHVLNTSYVLPASVIFFIGFFEAWPPLTTRFVSTRTAFVLMGSAVGWLMQIHMSWPLLLPFFGAALLARARHPGREFGSAVGASVLGFLITGSLLVPTIVKYGVVAGTGSTGRNFHLHWRNPITTGATTIARFLSFASFEISRFIASGTAKRILFFADRWWLVPVAALVGIAGLVHPAWMAITAWRLKSTYPEWPAVRWTAAATAALAGASFFFVMEPAQARTFYVVAPVAWLYAAYCWTFLDSARWRKVAAVAVGANIALQASLAVTNFAGPSLYLNRPLVAAAIRLKQPTIFGYRRWYARDAPATARTVAGGSPTAKTDLILDGRPEVAAHGLISWSIAIHNRSETTGYRSLRCETHYYDARGALVDQRIEEVNVVVEPGATISTRVIDSESWSPAVARTDVALLSAEPVDPFRSKQP